MNGVSWGNTPMPPTHPQQTRPQRPAATVQQASNKTSQVYATTQKTPAAPVSIKPYRPKLEKSSADKKVDSSIYRGDYDTAIKEAKVHIQTARDPETVRNCKKRLGHLYCDARRFDQAVKTFESIDGWQRDTAIIQAIAITFSIKKDYDSALRVLNNYWQNEDGMRCCKARIYQELKQYDVAIALVNECSSLYKDDATTFTLGRCLEALKRYDEAIEVYKIAKQYNPAKALENMGRCFANMGQNDNAIAAFEELVKRWPEPHYYIPYGRFYQGIGEHDKAIMIFKTHREWQTNTKLLIAMGCCYEDAGKYDQAIKIFQTVRNWAGNIPAILCYGRCLEKKEQWKQAETVFKMVYNWQTNPDALLCLARVTQLRLERSGTLKEEHKEVAQYFESMPNYRNNVQALIGLIWLYLRTSMNTRACFYLDLGLAHFPKCVELYRLKAFYFSVNTQLTEGIEFVRGATKQFPHDSKLALHLLEFYLKIEDSESAKHLQAKYTKDFAGNEQFMKDMKHLIGFIKSIMTQKKHDRYTYVDLPPNLSKIFEDIGKEKVYLVGSTVIDLISGNWSSQTAQDIDFATSDETLGKSLETSGFAAIGLVPGLYRRRVEAASPEIDVMLARMTLSGNEDEPWINHDVPNRDFTISALYCNHKGKVYDPTKRGLTDLKEKRLATVIDPVLCFQEDPICIFRGLKYISRGFIPTDAVQRAIRAWSPNLQTTANYIPHMAAVTRKLIRTNKAFLDLLTEYDLKDKLKALFQDPQYRQLVASLEPKVPLNFRKALTGNVQAPVEPGRRQILFTTLSFKQTTK